MTDSDHGTEQTRARGKKIEQAAETAVGGTTRMVDVWPDFIAFAHDTGLLNEDHYSGWMDFQRIRQATKGSDRTGTGGDGSGYQTWIDFGKMIGPKRLLLLESLSDHDAPPSTKPDLILASKLTFRLIAVKLRDALTAAGEAAQELRERRESQNPTTGNLPYAENR